METSLNAGPPRLVELAVRPFIPPMVREEVAGDLWERFESPAKYVADAVTALPFLIFSQARRATNGPLFALCAFTMFAAFGGFEPTLDAAGVAMWQRALVAVVPALAALLLCNAYRRDDVWTPRRAAGDLGAMLVAVLAVQALVSLLAMRGLIDPYWQMSTGFLIGGLVFTMTIVFVLRAGIDLAPNSLPAALARRPGAVEQDYRQFRRNLRFRNVVEIVALSFLLVIMLLYSVGATIPLVAKVAFAWVVLAVPLTAFKLLRDRTRPMPGSLRPADQLEFYCGELARQRSNSGFVWWLCFGPLFAGLTLNMVVRGLMNGWHGFALGGAICVALLAILIARASGVRKRQLGAKIAALRRLDRLRPH